MHTAANNPERPPRPIHETFAIDSAVFGNLSITYGVIVLDRAIDPLYTSAVTGYFDLMDNVLHAFDKWDFDVLCVVFTHDDSTCRKLAELAETQNNIIILCDMTGTLEARLPPNSIQCIERNSFSGDNATEWRYAGPLDDVPDEYVQVFYRAAQASFEFLLIQSIYGHVQEKEVVKMGQEPFVSRTRELFFAHCLDYVDFPMTDDELSELFSYLELCQTDDCPVRIGSPGARLLPLPDGLREYGLKLTRAAEDVRNARRIWAQCLVDSGSGMSNLSMTASIMADAERLPLKPGVRRTVADVVGVSSCLEAYASGVSIDDVLA